MSAQRDEGDSDRLPGELDRETERAAFMSHALRFLAETIDAVPDEHLAQVLAIYHEEWERRNPGDTWVIK